jgi:predicted transposase YdaD
MRRDTLFYRIFKEFPSLLFELTGNPPQNAAEYRFNSVEVKEPTFRIDGVFEPPVLDGTGKLYLAEVQMQLDEALCERTFAELFALFYRSRKLYSDWQCVMIYLSRSTEKKVTYPYRALVTYPFFCPPDAYLAIKRELQVKGFLFQWRLPPPCKQDFGLTQPP